MTRREIAAPTVHRTIRETCVLPIGKRPHGAGWGMTADDGKVRYWSREFYETVTAQHGTVPFKPTAHKP